MASGFSWPSTTFVCKAVYTSLKLMVAGAASSALNIDVSDGAGGTRSLKPFRSAAILMSREDDVMWRKPLSQILETVKIDVFAISARM